MTLRADVPRNEQKEKGVYEQALSKTNKRRKLPEVLAMYGEDQLTGNSSRILNRGRQGGSGTDFRVGRVGRV